MFNNINIFKVHKDSINTVIQLKDGRIVSGSDDHSLKVWDLDHQLGPQCIYTLEGHSDSITTVIQLQNGRIVSGSDDGTLRVWDLTKPSDEKCIATLKDPNNPDKPVLSVIQLKDERIVSVSDTTLKVWGKEVKVSNKIPRKLQNRALTPKEIKAIKAAANQVLPS